MDWNMYIFLKSEQLLPIRKMPLHFFKLSLLLERVRMFWHNIALCLPLHDTHDKQKNKFWRMNVVTPTLGHIDQQLYLKVRSKRYIMHQLDSLEHLKRRICDASFSKQSNITSDPAELVTKLNYYKQIKVGHKISSRTSCFLSDEKTACCHSVMAVSGGHIGLLHRALNVISLTWPSYSSAACHGPI